MKKIILSSSTEEFFHVLVSPGFEPGTSCTIAERATSRPRGKGKFAEKTCLYKIPIHLASDRSGIYNDKFFMLIFLLPVGLGVARLARVREVPGSNPGETRTWKNSTVEELKIIFFITLRVPTLRFGGSFFLYLTFYSNPFGHGVSKFLKICKIFEV